ncbi:hypothetical protein [Phenylobacterium sp.]|uniref:hypothetical protein n=1 Tax=Phenylobacterium sp. TaxID=1871053 RepID=UPI0012036537|nr:hypothetical protein [Phenylobacterium sp.]THD58075.1 MAG: hypothetical protein E8A49_20610 [Phenylobacterium sp.]
MPGWENFFMAQVGASASLAGLVFVGVSLNLNKIVSSGYLPNRAQEALLVLLMNLVLSLLFLVPGQTPASFGGQVLCGGLFTWGVIIWLHVDSFRRMDAAFRRRALTAAILGQVMAALITASGGELLLRGAPGVYWLVPGMLLTYFVALANAWVLAVEINR